MAREVTGNRIPSHALLVALALTSCARESPPSVGTTFVSDSAGVQIATTDLSDPSLLPMCEIQQPPMLRVGTADGQSQTELFRVEGALRLHDGALLVLNRGSRELLVFAQDGSRSMRIGTEGDGPGEFRDPVELHRLGADSVVVWDWGQGRATVLTPALTYARSFTLLPSVPNPTGHFGVIADGRSVVVSFHKLEIPTGSSFVPQSILLLRYSADGVFEDTVAVLPYGRAGVIDAESRMLGSPLFEPRASFTTDGEATYFSTGSDAEVRILDGSLRLVRLIRWQTPDRTITEEDVQAFRSERLKDVSEGLLPLMRRRYEAVPVGDKYPPVAAILVDGHKRLWVQRFQRPRSDDQEWWSYDAQGRFRCALSVPRYLSISQFGSDFVTAVSTDELGVESVLVLTLSSPES